MLYCIVLVLVGLRIVLVERPIAALRRWSRLLLALEVRVPPPRLDLDDGLRTGSPQPRRGHRDPEVLDPSRRPVKEAERGRTQHERRRDGVRAAEERDVYRNMLEQAHERALKERQELRRDAQSKLEASAVRVRARKQRVQQLEKELVLQRLGQ